MARTTFFPGSDVGRAAMALINNKGNRDQAARFAKDQERTWGTGPQAYLRTAVPVGGSDSWGQPFVPDGAPEFIELARRESLLRIPGLMSAPAFAQLVEVTSNGNASWVGESFPKPATAASLKRLGALPTDKVTALAVITDELRRRGGSAGEQLLTRALSTTCGAAIDKAFADVSNAGVGGAKPPSIGHNVPPIASTGDVAADVVTALGTLANPSAAVIALASLDAASLGAMRDGNGGFLFPDLGAKGGTILTLPAYTSDAMPRGHLLVFDPGRVYIWNGGLSIDYSDQATVILDDDPANASSNPVSLWGLDMHGLLVEIGTSWLAADKSVAVVALA